ncbi:uncharacterized protein LOC130666848 [Microplitis mediator]|uniref:uncharacterized protein LOC130666848 n=1 Tax=Microplitis mediator TaxID=375433 RepID=UPI0025522BDC|nr:uncharacterized protein LOC130666848 [Microplitis mediator]
MDVDENQDEADEVNEEYEQSSGDYEIIDEDDSDVFEDYDVLSEDESGVSDDYEVLSDDEELIIENEPEINDNKQEEHDSTESSSHKFDINELVKWVMFKSSGISVWEVLHMVTAITIRFNLSDEAQQAILQLIKLLAGPEFDYLDTSKYFMSKIFHPPTNIMLYVFYCESCNLPLNIPMSKYKIMKKKSTKCEKCLAEYKLSTSKDNFFMSLDVKYQIKNLLSNQSVRNMIDYQLLVQNNNDSQVIRDICDSDRYINDNYIISKKNVGDIVLTLNVNTDGAPQFKSSQRSFWPIQCVINEIPESVRHKFVVLAGLWYTATEPKPQFMNLYLQTFINQISNLMYKGLEIKTENGAVRKYFCKVFSFPVDSVARPILQNRLQFNGTYGCSWCYQQGVFRSGAIRYLFTETTPEERSHEKFLKDVEDRKEHVKNLKKTKKNEKYTVRGVKGPTSLSSLSNFDCIWGFPHDYMHGVLLGVSRQLWTVWSTRNLDVNDKKVINERLLNIKPPNEIHRVPRVLTKRKAWKATEWRSWLLFYSIPVLTNILDQERLDSYKLLVKSVHKLLSRNISDDDLTVCEMNLLRFIYDCQRFYGSSFMTFNVHSLKHMARSVRENGPSSSTSAYPFENNIYNLKLKATGPHGVLNQMANRSLRDIMFKSKLNTVADSTSWVFCKSILNKRKEKTINFMRSNDGAVLMKEEKKCVINELGECYNRCVYNDIMYHSCQYEKTNKTNNTIVQLEDKRFAEIQCFYLKNYLTFIEVDILIADCVNDFEHIFKITKRANKSIILPVTKIISKVILVTVGNDNYICMQPNNFEVQ